MTNNSVKYKVFVKLYLRAILDINEKSAVFLIPDQTKRFPRDHL